MAKSIWKGPILSLSFSPNQQVPRFSLITPSCIGNQYFVSNGKRLTRLTIHTNMVGHKFGEFVATRGFPKHKKKDKKLIRKK